MPSVIHRARIGSSLILLGLLGWEGVSVQALTPDALDQTLQKRFEDLPAPWRAMSSRRFALPVAA
ncbi:MAG: hypothetical protein OEW39_15085 [Deltaproteobacteria bacterium]|nr:hypothetical protein [Deltaproteobacteria bacterium]